MSTLIDLEALAIEHLQSEHFANYLAECVSTLYRDKLMDEFHNEVAAEISKKVKEVAAEYIESFDVQADIEYRVKQALTAITKKELLEKLQ